LDALKPIIKTLQQ